MVRGPTVISVPLADIDRDPDLKKIWHTSSYHSHTSAENSFKNISDISMASNDAEMSLPTDETRASSTPNSGVLVNAAGRPQTKNLQNRVRNAVEFELTPTRWACRSDIKDEPDSDNGYSRSFTEKSDLDIATPPKGPHKFSYPKKSSQCHVCKSQTRDL